MASVPFHSGNHERESVCTAANMVHTEFFAIWVRQGSTLETNRFQTASLFDCRVLGGGKGIQLVVNDCEDFDGIQFSQIRSHDDGLM